MPRRKSFDNVFVVLKEIPTELTTRFFWNVSEWKGCPIYTFNINTVRDFVVIFLKNRTLLIRLGFFPIDFHPFNV